MRRLWQFLKYRARLAFEAGRRGLKFFKLIIKF